MEHLVDNNQYEVKPNLKNKRKFSTPCPNAYLNPALDLLANEDPICNNVMEIVPNKKLKRTRSCDIVTFENSALDVGVSKAAVNEFLMRELENVKKSLETYREPVASNCTKAGANEVETLYSKISDEATNSPMLIESNESVMNISPETNSLPENSQSVHINIEAMDSGVLLLNQKSIESIENINLTNHISTNNQNLSFSFIDRLVLDSPLSNQSLYCDDDLNESNIMEIKTITVINKEKRVPRSTNPFLNLSLDESVLRSVQENPFIHSVDASNSAELEYEVTTQPVTTGMNLVPRKLFTSEMNSTISTVNESIPCDTDHEYQNIDNFRPDSPIYENISDDVPINYNKQSKILGLDVSHFSAVDIMNLNKTSQVNSSNESDGKGHFKHNLFKTSNKLSKKLIKALKKKFKVEKPETNVTLNPYEVPRKVPKSKTKPKDDGIENPALKLDNSDEIEYEELDDEENQYETIKTLRNTRLNMNVTPLKERVNEPFESCSRTTTPGKKQVRFDSTLNQEKYITGDSFECDVQSPGFDSKIDKYHDELENCINERKFIEQNM